MRLISAALSAVVLATSLFGVYRLSWLPYRCETKKVRLDMLTKTANEEVNDYQKVLLARTNLEQMAPCRALLPHDLQFNRLGAANERMVGRPDDAIATLRRALETDRRPELYWEIGMLHFEHGRIEEGFRWLNAAASFSPRLMDSPNLDATMRERLREARRVREAGLHAGTWREPPLPR